MDGFSRGHSNDGDEGYGYLDAPVTTSPTLLPSLPSSQAPGSVPPPAPLDLASADAAAADDVHAGGFGMGTAAPGGSCGADDGDDAAYAYVDVGQDVVRGLSVKAEWRGLPDAVAPVSPKLLEPTYGVGRSSEVGPTAASVAPAALRGVAEHDLDVDDMSALLSSTVASIVTPAALPSQAPAGTAALPPIGGDVLALLGTTAGASALLPSVAAPSSAALPLAPPGPVLGRFTVSVRCGAADLQDTLFRELPACCAPDSVSVSACSAHTMHVTFKAGHRLAVRLYSVADGQHVVAFGRCPAGLAPRKLKSMHAALTTALQASF